MIVVSQILGFTLVFCLNFYMIRMILWHVLVSTVGKKRRKRVASRTFFEWISMKKYFGVIPRWLLGWYYSNFLVYLLLVIAVFILYLCNMSEYGHSVVLKGYFTVYGISDILVLFMYPIKKD